MIREAAYAKLNLSLDVQEKRTDGYHNMLMVMQTIDLCDHISLDLRLEAGIFLTCNYGYIPTDGRNLACKAANLFLKACGREGQGISIRMKKEIPVGAGMAGGSADAAAVLRGMNRLLKAGMGRRELEKLAEQVGSDVAFCVAGGTALAKGRGEMLEDLPPMPDCSIVVCKPSFSISTPELFGKLDRVKLLHHPDTDGMLEAIRENDLRGTAIRMYNVFEEVDDRRMRIVADIKGALLDGGAAGAVMTGTGSAVFGLFSDEEKAKKSAEKLSKEYSFCRIAKPIKACLFDC
ncbi:MAG: 4-(cytidine 5'-diphospho)-2-C-methyl-D-erythritol kinase [Oscillospiraceae bacterium]|nr:4-(cytidine 5'-diphospho)-2-C-methyl-D-erythritol kinase [Oscillospiraceae bacterium]